MNKKSIYMVLMYSVLLLLLVHPPYLERFVYIQKVYNYSFPFCLLLIGVIFLRHCINKKSVNKYCILICLFVLIPILYSIFIGRIISFTYYRIPVTTIALTLLLTEGFESNFKESLLSICLVLGSYVFVNFMSIVLFPDALYSTEIYKNLNWFLGYKNIMVRTILPTLCSIAIYSVYRINKLGWVYWFFFVISLLSEIMVDCKTGALGVIIFGVIVFLYRNKGVSHFFNLRTLGFVILGISILFTLFNVIDHFYSYLGDIGETGSMTNRLLIWKRALVLIEESPILGYGYRNTEGMRALMNFSLRWTDASHPHNYFLFVLIQGGFVLFLLGMYIFSKLGKTVEKNANNFISVAVFAMYVSFLTMGLVESLVGTILLYPMVMLVIPMKNKAIYCRKVSIHFS